MQIRSTNHYLNKVLSFAEENDALKTSFALFVVNLAAQLVIVLINPVMISLESKVS